MTDSETGWRFDNSYARLPEPLFTRAEPGRVRAPRMVVFHDALAGQLGLPSSLADAAAVLAGNELPDGAEPIAQAYAGHQFGHFTNLGDGRAILLGEQLTPSGSRRDIQLKGSGRTRYSRSGDGRAALGPMLREYLISEAMHALGIPTTRSLAVVATGEVVMRERPLPGAILTRVAMSHLRVGTFQYAAALGDPTLLATLLNYAIERHDPELLEADDPAVAFFAAVAERQAALVAQWMLVGFVHGVMNTDNMAIAGETIDYGPCAFLDIYDPQTVFSSIDQQGRYAYANQPLIAQWNLARLAESVLPLVKGDEQQAVDRVREVLETFSQQYKTHYAAGAAAKLGLAASREGDEPLFTSLLASMQQAGADFTATFAQLSHLLRSEGPSSCLPAGVTPSWVDAWRRRLAQESAGREDQQQRMQRANPLVIPRNHKVEEALSAAEVGDMQPFTRLLAAVTHPFEEASEHAAYRLGPPAGCGPYRTFCGT
ncbi:MAG: protein adenylyltransferase SelO [Pirellulales bacterium]|jgi:uncharacterized protein YdiU (UPF0061 family)